MDAARWEQVQALFHRAADVPDPERARLLEQSCAGDAELLAEVRAMLEEEDRASLLDRNLSEIAGGLLEQPLPFREIGRYRLKRLLGEGGMGVVYLAERDDLGSLAAIKILRDAWLSPARRERFAAEQRTLAQLNHPSIARLYDADTLPDGTPWFAMEYVEGLPLTEFCTQRASSVEERLRLFREVCVAVQHAHLHAVIHRDLKPSNILVRADGNVRLLDFGIAKQLDAASDQTRTAFRMMTPAYAAPEQIRGERVGIYTDVYSLGVILYELLAEKLPFDFSARTPGEAERIIADQEPAKPCGIADLDVLCLTAMHKAPERRYASAEALIRDLDHYRNGEPLEAQPDTLRYRAGKFVRRNRRAVAAASLAFAVLIGLSVFFTARLAIARNAAIAQARRTQRIQQFMLNLFQGGDQAAGPGENLRVGTLLDRGAEEARLLNSEPAAQAELYYTLGSMYEKLGKFDRADAMLQSSLDERRAAFGKDSAETAGSLIALGLLRIDQEKLPEAEALVRQGLEMTRRHPGDFSIARADLALGRVLEARGNYDQAATILDEAVRLSPPGTADYAASLNELASVHFYAGRYQIADQLFRRVLGLHRQLYGDRHPLVADDLLNLGAVQFDLGYYRQAEEFDRQGLALDLAYYGPGHPQTAHAYTVLGRALVYEKQFDQAAGLLEKSLAIEERVYGPRSPQVASALNELGNTAYWRGQLDQAQAYFTRMVEIYRAVYNNHHYLIGIALSNLAGVFLLRNQDARAEQLYREALQAFVGTLPPDHLNVGIADIKLGHVLLLERRYAEAEKTCLAGYAILARQANPQGVHLKNVRTDLAAIYEALGQPGQAAHFRAELANTHSN